jgi:signal transduction histidine kinase
VSRIRTQLVVLLNKSNKDIPCRYINDIRKEIDRLDKFISELLTYARLDGHPPPLSIEFYPLIPWIMGITDYMTIELREKQFKLHHPNTPQVLHARFDPKHMGQAVSHLLDNAATYGCNRVEMTVTHRDENVFLHIDDDGPGIPDEEQFNIFKPFIRLNGDTYQGAHNSGLGLAIVKRVMQWHDGSVTVSPSLLGGSRFSLQWPGLKK